MVAEPTMAAIEVDVEPESDLARALTAAPGRPVVLRLAGARFRVAPEGEDVAAGVPAPIPDHGETPMADPDDIWAGYDPELARQSTLAAAGSWKHVDTEALKADIYARRKRPSTRPPVEW